MTLAQACPIVLTPGDPCGIGPEIIARAWCEVPTLVSGCFVAGDLGVMHRAAALVSQDVPLAVVEIEDPSEAQRLPAGCLPVLQVVAPVPSCPGAWSMRGRARWQENACSGPRVRP